MEKDSEWTEEEEEILINFWREEKALYDVKSKSYSDKHLKQRKIEEIAAILNKSAFEIKKHINSLRTQYNRYKKLGASGSGTKFKTSRQQWIVTHCGWLSDYIKHHTSQSNLDESVETTDVEISSDIVADEVETASSTPSITPVDQPVAKPKKRNAEEVEEEFKILRNISSRLDNDKSKSDDDIFGEYVSSELKAIKSKRSKVMLKHAIQHAIYESQLSELEE